MRIACILIAFCSATQMFSQNLSSYRWEKRLVILVSPNLDSPLAQKQLQLFEKEAAELKERDMLLLKIEPNNQELTKFSITKNFEGVLLIGKDGGLKASYKLLVQPKTLFDLVDSMPMRRAEMRKGNRN